MARWNPNHIERPVDRRLSSTNVVIVETDIGPGFVKVMGNPAGDHCLACDFICTQLAEWLGLPTLDYGLVEIDAKIDEIRLYNGSMARSGPAFITRTERGEPWDGSKKQLDRVCNPDDIARLVVFDTWVMNGDRQSSLIRKPDNVLLSMERGEAGKPRLVAIDHTHCLTDSTGTEVDLTKTGSADVTEVFGLFREFRSFLNRSGVREIAGRLNSLDSATVTGIVESIPVEWRVPKRARNRLIKLIIQRAARTADTIEELLLGPAQTQRSLELGSPETDK